MDSEWVRYLPVMLARHSQPENRCIVVDLSGLSSRMLQTPSSRQTRCRPVALQYCSILSLQLDELCPCPQHWPSTMALPTRFSTHFPMHYRSRASVRTRLSSMAD